MPRQLRIAGRSPKFAKDRRVTLEPPSATVRTLRTDPNECTYGKQWKQDNGGIPPAMAGGKGGFPATSSDNWRQVTTILATRPSKISFVDNGIVLETRFEKRLGSNYKLIS